MPNMTKGERSVAETITPFTKDLPATVAAEVEAATMRIKTRMARTIVDIIGTGHDLKEVKSKLEHGQFESWLSTMFNMTDRTARRYMQAATWAEGKSDTVSDLTPQAIYLLSAPTTPKAAQKEVLEHLEAGKPITHHEVCEVVEILVNKLSADEVDRVHEVLSDYSVTHSMLRDAIAEAGGGGYG